MLGARLCDLLGISHPVIQAPIWPAATPELVAAVCNAGGLGSLPAIYESVENLRRQIPRVRELTDRPFAVNHVVPFLDEEAFAYTLEARPAVISLSLGDPGDFVKRAHDAGIKVMQQIHTVQQAQQAAERGVDVIIAQGAEGGGQGYPLGVGIMVLLPQVVDAVKPIPVVAAGGIADGRGLAAAFVLGAEGVNMGTRFVASEEASSNASWRKALIAARSEDTVRFEVWKEIAPPAKPGAYPFAPRVLRSAFVDEWQARPDEAKRQAERLRVEVKAAVRDHRLAEILPFAGQTVGMITDILPAAEIVRRIVREARQVLEGALRT